MSDQPNLDAAMAGFRARSLATNLQRAATIAEAFEALRDGAGSEDSRAGARAAAHALAGSAGTFGFAEASQLGRDLEVLLDRTHGLADAQAIAQQGLAWVSRLREVLTDPHQPGSSTPGLDGSGNARP